MNQTELLKKADLKLNPDFYDGEQLKEVVNESSFRNYFGDFEYEDKLKTFPKRFAKEHPHLDLLRLRILW